MLKKLYSFAVLSPLAVAAMLTGCQTNGGATNPNPLPSGAASLSGEALPPGFSGINPETGAPVTLSDWNSWQKDGRLLPYNPDGGTANNATAKAQFNDAQAFTNIVTATNPQLAGLLADPDSSDPTTVPVSDGNFLHTINVKTPATLAGNIGPQAQLTVMTLGNTSKTLIMGNAAARFLGDSNLVLQNQVTIYSRFYNQVKTIYPALLDRYGMPNPSTLGGKSVATVKGLVDKFGPIYNLLVQQPVPASTARPSAAGEYGVGSLNQFNIGDRTSTGCGNSDYVDPKTQQSYPSIYNRYNWPMKQWETSVKEQGSRGSCVSFGVNAAMEADISHNHGYWMNLSEQDLYYHMKGYWWPIGDSYGDGSDTHGVFDKMNTFTWTDPVCSQNNGSNCVHNTTYHIPLETQWEYNPSWNRTEDSDNCGKLGAPACMRVYTQSCANGYNPDPTHPQDYCSDTNHQGFPLCFDYSGFNWCSYLTPVAQNTATQGTPTVNILLGTQIGQPYFSTGDAEVWDSNDTQKSVDMMTWALIFQSPIVAGIAVPPSWDNNTNGYISYVGASEKNRGGHAVEVSGYIDNSQLPQGAPLGSGGGYFIIKNSWGTCFGDGGYVYAPIDWIKAYAYSMVILNGLN